MNTRRSDIWKQIDDILTSTNQEVKNMPGKTLFDRIADIEAGIKERLEAGSCKDCFFCVPFDSCTREELENKFKGEGNSVLIANKVLQMAEYYCFLDGDMDVWFTAQLLEEKQYPLTVSNLPSIFNGLCLGFKEKSVLYSQPDDDELERAKQQKRREINMYYRILNQKAILEEFLSSTPQESLKETLDKYENGDFSLPGKPLSDEDDMPF